MKASYTAEFSRVSSRPTGKKPSQPPPNIDCAPCRASPVRPHQQVTPSLEDRGRRRRLRPPLVGGALSFAPGRGGRGTGRGSLEHAGPLISADSTSRFSAEDPFSVSQAHSCLPSWSKRSVMLGVRNFGEPPLSRPGKAASLRCGRRLP